MRAMSTYGYREKVQPSDEAQYSQYWELRIKIQKKDVARAVQLLEGDLNAWGLPWKHFLYQPEHDDANPAISSKGIYSGGDRDQCWKTICIYLPDDRAQDEGLAYKNRLLAMWKVLQDNSIGIVYGTPIGDQSFDVEGAPTPFSYTAFKPFAQPTGIVAEKNYNPRGYVDPLATVSITRADLSAAGIRYNPVDVLEKACKDHADDAASGSRYVAEALAEINKGEALTFPTVSAYLPGFKHSLVTYLDKLPVEYSRGTPLPYVAVEELRAALNRHDKGNIEDGALFEAVRIFQRKFNFEEIMKDARARLRPIDLGSTLPSAVISADNKNPKEVQRLMFCLYHTDYHQNKLIELKARLDSSKKIRDMRAAISGQIMRLKASFWNPFLSGGDYKVEALKKLQALLDDPSSKAKTVTAIIQQWKATDLLESQVDKQKLNVAGALHQQRSGLTHKDKSTSTEVFVEQFSNRFGGFTL